jgi:hypothetical protein
MYYLANTEPNRNAIELRVTEFNALIVSNIGVAELCDWQPLGRIVDRLFSSAINGDSNVAC